MAEVLTTFLLAAVIGLTEGMPLYRKKLRKEFVALIILLIIAMSLMIIKAFGLPTPLDILESLLSQFGTSIFRYE